MKKINIIFVLILFFSCTNDPERIVHVGDSLTVRGDWKGENYGINGAQIRDLEDFDELGSPDIIYVWIGTNDLGFGRSIPQIINDYEDLLEDYISAEVHVLSIPHINPALFKAVFGEEHHYNNNTHLRVTVLNREIKKLCEDFDVNFINITDTLGYPNPYTVDGLHLNKSGYKKIYKKLP